MTRSRNEENMACSRHHQALAEMPVARDKGDTLTEVCFLQAVGEQSKVIEHEGDMLIFVLWRGVTQPEPMKQFQPQITQRQREGAGDGTQGCVSPSLYPLPLPSYFSPSWDLYLGWDWHNACGGSASLDQGPVHTDGVDLGGGVSDRLYKPLQFCY